MYSAAYINRKYYQENGNPIFHQFNSDHYAMFLYFLSNTLYKNNKIIEATKIFLLNKALHGIDAFYSIVLPEIFYFVHPIGTILGNAVYSDYLVVYQGVTVGSDRNEQNINGLYPEFSKGCTLLANSSIIGKCRIGENVILGAHSFIRNRVVSDNIIILGQYPNNQYIENRHHYLNYYFGQSLK
ncbi:MAG: serine acetyltransferase [Thiothrix sp.]|nr:MAG: serine acetyltransferase [Thiothrix sp.]